MQGITSIVRRVNNTYGGGRTKKEQANKPEPKPKPSNIERREDKVYEKQIRMNALEPTRTGVISSPDPREQSAI